MKKCRECKFDVKHCPLLMGGEAYHKGEDDEWFYRKTLLPLLKKLYKTGERILRVKEANG